MITSTRIGRYGDIGNSIFQLAAVIGMGKKTGLEVAIPHNETYYEPECGRNITSIFEGFDINLPILDLGILKLKEIEFPFHYADKKVGDFTDMKGFFQTEKYFENAIVEVREQLKFKKHIKEIINTQINNGYYPDPSLCTSLHIRLGDYVYKRDYHPAMSADYWQAAIKKTNPDKLIIFSDDTNMAKQIFGESNKITYSTDDNPFVALYHMSMCKNNIICNSTFSWWGAWLGEANTADKIVVAPKLWFGDGHKNFNSKDLIPDRWVKI